jgi:hypothetical protein
MRPRGISLHKRFPDRRKIWFPEVRKIDLVIDESHLDYGPFAITFKAI